MDLKTVFLQFLRRILTKFRIGAAETGSGAWCPKEQINASSHEWIQVEFPTNTVITGVKTQGRWDGGRGREYPPAYSIEYWRESFGAGGTGGGSWARYKDGTGNEASFVENYLFCLN